MTVLRLAVAVLAVIASRIAGAALFCPSNEAELRQALTAAATNNEDDEIRLRTGTFFTGGQTFAITTTEARSLSISGGWTDDIPLFCSRQVPSASATVIDGQNLTAVLDINAHAFGSGAANATVSLGNLTIRNGHTSTIGESAGLRIGTGYQTLRLERTILTGHRQTASNANIYNNAVTLSGSGDIYVLGNAMGDLQSRYANLAIFTGSASQTVYLTNNTLSLNGGGFDALLDANNGTAFRLVNNAVVATDFGGLYFNSRNASDPIRLWMFNNLGQWDYYALQDRISVQADSGNRTALDPRFVDAGDFRPGTGSPLVNAGINSPFGGVPDVDLDGAPRVDLGVIDVGAFESRRERIFASGFD